MFERLVHSNNTGTVGWTCIHAWMNTEGMEMLISIAPRGIFTPTYYKGDCREVRDPYAHEMLYGETTMGYYFTFPMDENGERLIATLAAMCGMAVAPALGKTLTRYKEQEHRRQAYEKRKNYVFN